ncbi:sigma-70 family RNA polymerase sigma factor [Anaeromassilibacillus senegalensis]|uniref:sigma-70 family RNA polymerase sigma factor n=1 Tax=Anaeromassilibacillus senegalensis TaxID=1673717 RepID=UPI0006827666|nr:sigma-70 family RNA polymerase sigma factor [Anaeromassilibacillus senegalensis]
MAQSGDQAAAAQLWEQVKRLVFLFAFKFFHAQRPACASCGVEIEDVQQEAFLAVIDAVEDFSPAKGYKFNSYLRFHAKNRFNALIGYRGNRAPRPLDRSASLDEAVAGEDDDLSLLELVEDPTAAGAFEDAEEREYTRQLYTALQQAMDMLDKQ